MSPRWVSGAAFALLVAAQALGFVSCTSRTRPSVLARVEEVKSAPATLEAKRWAPQAYAEALRLEATAKDAFEEGDPEATRIASEGALAAHEHAWVLTRLVRAEQRRIEARSARDEAMGELALLHAQHQKVSAKAAALELRARVRRAAAPLPVHERVSPERDVARRRAARALSSQGRLLCVAARLLEEGPGVDSALKDLDQLDADLDVAARRDLLQRATALRSRCLQLLTDQRATKRPVAGSGVPADALLAELSAAGLLPSRDDRGVAVILRKASTERGEALSRDAKQYIERVSKVAARHPDTPLLLVAHAGSSGERVKVKRELGLIQAELERLGVRRIAAQDVGTRQPVALVGRPGSTQRNTRHELIFVSRQL